MRYNRNSVLYLRWDHAQYIYLISEGVVVLAGDAPKLGEKVKFGKGDFIGLYAALGNFPYQEDAMTETDVEVMIFSVEEFETLVANKTNLSIQLLQMLSQELRKTHKKAKEILAEKTLAAVDQAQGLYSYAKLYTESNEVEKAKYVVQTFLRMFPTHSRADEVKVMAQRLKGQ